MTSHAKIAANRTNARRSSGPRTAAGKARSRRNAFKHGLSLPLRIDENAAQTQRLASQLSALVSGPPENIYQVAVTQLEFRRIQEAKRDLINRILRQSLNAPDGARKQSQMAHAVIKIAPLLSAFVRYETRAFSRRRKALRALEPD
jgi:hypothetical protein